MTFLLILFVKNIFIYYNNKYEKAEIFYSCHNLDGSKEQRTAERDFQACEGTASGRRADEPSLAGDADLFVALGQGECT